jgi:HSP20 family protein
MASRLPTPYASSRELRGFDPLTELHREMNRLFDTMFSGGPGSALSSGSGAGPGFMHPPRLDVREDERELCITVDLPGVSPSDVDVRLDGDLLTVSGEKKSESSDEQPHGYHVMERGWGRFQRTVQLPFVPDPDQVRADCEHGVLTIRLPKQAQLERSRRIQVGTGSGQPATGTGAQESTGDAPRVTGGEPPGAAGETGTGGPNVHH